MRQRATWRRFTAADKLRILAEADACKLPGQLGALLRREGLYSSTLASFRKQRDEGKLGKDQNLARQQRRDKEAARQRDARKIAHLETENKKLRLLLELQKKGWREKVVGYVSPCQLPQGLKIPAGKSAKPVRVQCLVVALY